MILLTVKHYIKQHKNVSAQQLQTKFDLSPEALEGLLTPLLQQGHIQKTHPPAADQNTSCSNGNCASNSPKTSQIHYTWSDKAFKPLSIQLEIH